MKKLKLFLSLCMMCLCVAVLCMGILAASSATYNITGSMTYNMTADLAKINTRVYRVAEKSTESALETAVSSLSTKTYAQIERDTTTTYIEHQRLSTLNAISETSTEQQFSSEAISMTFGEIEKEDECYYTYYIVISIVNKSTDGTLTATLTDTIATDTTFYRYTNATQTEIANDETKNIVIGISKIDDTEMTEQTFAYTLTVSYVEEVGPKLVNSGTYWYTELGTLSDGTPIRWRVVSLNGEKPYEYKSTKPEIGTGTVFLQETYLGSTVAFDTSNSNNYYNSSIRTTINTITNKTLTTWNINESDISSLIAKRNITEIEDSAGTVKYTGTTNDYFWLLSSDEAETYLGTESSDRIWTPNNNGTSAVDWLIRTPGSTKIYFMCYLTTDGVFSTWDFDVYVKCAVRAAFQLA